MSRVSQAYQEARRSATAHQTNPVPYSADYAGHKLHLEFGNVRSNTRGSSGWIQWHDSGVHHNASQKNIEIYSNFMQVSIAN